MKALFSTSATQGSQPQTTAIAPTHSEDNDILKKKINTTYIYSNKGNPSSTSNTCTAWITIYMHVPLFDAPGEK
jgi:hypothetical protein